MGIRATIIVSKLLTAATFHRNLRIVNSNSMEKKQIILFLIGLIFYTFPLMAQAPPLKISSVERWPELGNRKITPDGKYLIYTYGSRESGSRLVIQESHGFWKTEVAAINDAYFTNNSRYAIFQKSTDTLCFLGLATHLLESIPQVNSYKMAKERDSQWLAYLKHDKELFVRNLINDSSMRFSSVVSYDFSSDGTLLLLQTERRNKDVSLFELKFLQLEGGKTVLVWQGKTKVENYCQSQLGHQLAFMTEENQNDHLNTSLYYYKSGFKRAQVLLADTLPAYQIVIRKSWGFPQFSKDGTTLFFAAEHLGKNSNIDAADKDNVPVTIWNYKDVKLKSQIMNEKENGQQVPISSIDLLNQKVTFVTESNEHIISDLKESHHHLVLIYKLIGDRNEWWWNPVSKAALILIDTHTGTKRVIKEGLIPVDLMYIQLSPGGKYVVYYDMNEHNYFCYNIRDDTTVNITKKISYALFDIEHDLPGPPRAVAPPVWLQKDQAILIQDYYDIWEVDPDIKKEPLCLTAFYGRQHRTILRLMDGLSTYPEGIKPKDDILLAALDKRTKKTGFFKTCIGTSAPPKLLTLDTFIYYYPQPSWQIHSYAPVKAKNKELYLIERMGVNEAKNLYLSSDLIHYEAITHLEPQKKYNWMTADLLEWKLPNDNVAEAILYKPQNFDPQKKYPVIFSLYEKYADELYNFKAPKPGADLDIAYFVSNGYLVVTPSIRYKSGEPGYSAYSTVMSAALYLARFPWVDTLKLGLQGQSFGAYEVNYIITHSHLFAAAVESSGPVDFISGYGSLRGGSGSNQFIYEIYQSRIGATLWEKPDLYIKNSPIFLIDKISTPLLIMHNTADAQVPVQQGYELFTALRRLEKPSWMLQYNNEGHGISKWENRKDYAQRLSAFFDHFLKGSPMPKWMDNQPND